MLKITNYKITPQQLAEIESHLEYATFILNQENIPNWEDINTACRQIADAREDLKTIKEKVQTEKSYSVFCEICNAQDFGTKTDLKNRDWTFSNGAEYCPAHIY